MAEDVHTHSCRVGFAHTVDVNAMLCWDCWHVLVLCFAVSTTVALLTSGNSSMLPAAPTPMAWRQNAR